jgi:hypothetical protein
MQREMGSQPTAPLSQVRQQRLLTFDRLIVIVLFAALFAMAVRTPADTDMWWHLGAGRAIVTTGHIPYADEFSFTVRGKPWVDVQWLAQVGMYEARLLGGDGLLAILVAALAVVTFAFVYFQMAGGPFLRAFIIVLAATASSVIWSPRPQMLSFALLGVTGYIVYLFKWRQLNRLWVLIPLFALWGNVHGGYALGLMLIGCVIVGESLNRVTGRARLPEVLTWRELGLLTGVGVLCGLALLVNPYTFGTWVLPFRTVGIKTLQGFIQEWASPDFHNLYEQPVLWLLFALLTVTGLARRRWDWSDLILVLVFGYSAFLARRNIAPLALVIAPVLSRRAQLVVESASVRVQLPASARKDLNPALAPALNWLIVILVTVAALGKAGLAISPQMIERAQREVAPVRAVEWLRQSAPHLAGPMYNSYNWGGYLVWALPEEPVFVDGRTDVYGEFLPQYVQVMFVRPGWQDVLNRHGVRLVLVERESLLSTMLATQPDWQLVYSDNQAAIWERRGK